MKLRNVLSTLLAAASVAALSTSSYAVSVVDASVTTQISDTEADILTVGGAIISLAVVAMAIRWVKATFF